jgi:hypothetical protein
MQSGRKRSTKKNHLFRKLSQNVVGARAGSRPRDDGRNRKKIK